MGLIFMLAYAFASGDLRFSLGGTSTVSVQDKLFADVTGITPVTGCAGLSSSDYADNGLSITWPTMTQGSSGTVYICLRNMGLATNTLVFTPGPLPAGVSFSTPQQGAPLASTRSILVQLILTATPTATTSSFSFSLTIG